MAVPLMPKATAVWLVENTTLTFDQIAEFCALHALEIKAMADDMHPEKIVPLDPVMMGQLTRDEITAAEKDPRKRLVMTKSAVEMPDQKAKGRPRYTPVSRRQDRPDSVHAREVSAVFFRAVDVFERIDSIRHFRGCLFKQRFFKPFAA